tara:strand:- start:2320 stop:4869 length:2550 start_codon:yes stop_codon:yes gene_type:complete
VTFTREQAVQELAEVIRVYPRGGGPFPDGGKLLQNIHPQTSKWDAKRLKKEVLKDWDRKGAANPEEVADLLLGMSLDGAKAPNSVFNIAQMVSEKYKWNLNWDDEVDIGTYLLSCLIKIGYYEPKELWGDNHVSLHVRQKEIVGFAENHPWLSRTPFKPWVKAVDDEGRRLVKPSWPQLKSTEYKPGAKHFVGNKNLQIVYEARKRKVPDYLKGKSPKSATEKEYAKLAGQFTTRIDVYQNAPSIWVRAVNQLESTPYCINQEMLSLVNKVAGDAKKAPPRTDAKLEKEITAHQKKYEKVNSKSGMWKPFKRKEQRTLRHLEELLSLDKSTLKKAREKCENQLTMSLEKKKLKPKTPEWEKEWKKGWKDKWKKVEEELEPSLTPKQRLEIEDHIEIRKGLARIRNQVLEVHKNFRRQVRQANDLGPEPFFQRAFADSRGRLYLNKTSVNYQAGDLCRSLLQFSVGYKVPKKAMKHLWVHLATTYGEKGDEKERAKAGEKLRDKALRYAKDPLGTYDVWSKDANDKWQFIRTCIEVRDVLNDKNHRSQLIVELDQSMSALQHIALLRGDAALADSVNMGKTHRDTYQEVADGIDDLRKLDAKTRRKIVKLAFLGWVYGGNWTTAAKRYTANMADIPFLRDLGWQGRQDLAIKVVAELNGLAGLGTYRRELRKESLRQQKLRRKIPHLRWVSPSGFEVRYYKQETKRRRPYIQALKDGESKGGRPKTKKLVAWEPTETPDSKRLRSTIAPSVVHSIDAAIAHHVLMRAGEEGVYIVAVHDAFGVHLHNVGKVARLFRDYLIELYADRLKGWHGFREEQNIGQVLKPIVDDETYRKLINKCLRSPHIIDGLV